jgi:hypothetical protein
MPIQEEPTVESLSLAISELQRMVKDLQVKVEAISRRTPPAIVVPQIPSPGSIGEKNLAIGQIAVNPHAENIHRIAYERAINQ